MQISGHNEFISEHTNIGTYIEVVHLLLLNSLCTLVQVDGWMYKYVHRYIPENFVGKINHLINYIDSNKQASIMLKICILFYLDFKLPIFQKD